MSQTQIWQLVARKVSGEASLDELKALERLLRDEPELAYKVELYCRYFEKPPTSIRRTEARKQQSLEHFRQRFSSEFPADEKDISLATSLPQAHSGRVGIRKWLAAAFVALIAGTGIWIIIRESSKPNEASFSQAQVNEVNTMPGTRSKNILPDGTIVWLNSDSRISYNTDFGKQKRDVTLIGEAFFDVAHNETVPMLVHARSVTILVKGTAFNVRSYPGSATVQTSLLRGSVELTTAAKPREKILLKPNEKITIEVGEESGKNVSVPPNGPAQDKRAHYHIDHLKQSTLAPLIPEVSWVENRLVFDNEPFDDVIDKMEKWYNVDIILINKKGKGKKFSGVFEKENIEEALSALQLVNHFQFEIKGRTVIIQ